MPLIVLSTNKTTLPHPATITTPNNRTFKDLVEALSTACSLRDDERLLVAEDEESQMPFITGVIVKIPRDLTETSFSGAGLSMIAAFCMMLLFGMVETKS